MKRKNKETIKQENITDVASNVPSIVETSNKKSKNKFITKILSNKFVAKFLTKEVIFRYCSTGRLAIFCTRLRRGFRD